MPLSRIVNGAISSELGVLASPRFIWKMAVKTEIDIAISSDISTFSLPFPCVDVGLDPAEKRSSIRRGVRS